VTREVDAILAARMRLRGRPVRSIAEALAAAASRWRDDPGVRTELARTTDLSPAMLDAVLPLVAEAIDAGALVELHAREGQPDGPALIAHVLASNVPALAVPAITLSCLTGGAVVVKSGRADRVSAPAFARAVAEVDPDLGATILATYWPHEATDTERAVLAAADVVTITGTNEAIAAVSRRTNARIVAHGARTSVALMRDQPGDTEIAALAMDVARYEQRGCLSPTTVLVDGDVQEFAERLLAALDAAAVALPMPRSTTARATRRVALEAARFAGATVLEGSGGAVVLGASANTIDDALTGRTIAVRKLEGGSLEPFRRGEIECIGIDDVMRIGESFFQDHGVSRICPVGRMQRPRIDWPRGQRPALGSLFRDGNEPRIQIESWVES
jgi:acyl-CoA reductase LuxC